MEPNNKETLEMMITYFLNEIEFQKELIRHSKHDIDDATEDGDNSKLRIHTKMLRRREAKMNDLHRMLDFVQRLHYEMEVQ